jgi:hypothetical protein
MLEVGTSCVIGVGMVAATGPCRSRLRLLSRLAVGVGAKLPMGSISGLAADVGQHDCVFRMPCGLLRGAVLSSRLGEELLEILQKVRRATEQGRHLGVDVLDGL